MFKKIIRLLRGTSDHDVSEDFNPDFYKSLYSDLNGEDPLIHWRQQGRREGRIGNIPTELPAFDPDYYLSRYSDVGIAGVDPFHHWLRFGRLEGRVAAWPADQEGNFPRLRQMIEQYNFFDRETYLANYLEDISEGHDPLDYYISVGQHNSHKPNNIFDPLIYLLNYPDAHYLGPVLHYLERLRNGEASIGDLCYASVFSDIRQQISWPGFNVQSQELKDRDRNQGIEQSEAFAQEQVLEFTIDDKKYSLVAPSADDLFNRIRDDQAFALSRLPHGFWDGLLYLSHARDTVTAKIAVLAPKLQLSDDDLDRLAERACDTILPEMGIYQENFLRELFNETTSSEVSKDHLRSVSFKWQPTVENRVFGRTDTMGGMELDQLKFFSKYFKPEHSVFEAMIWKRWVFSGDVMRLPVEARDRPVVLVGPERMAELGMRWKLPWFSHVTIPLINHERRYRSYELRYSILEQCKDAVQVAKALAIENGTKKPLIVFQGGSFAYWLIARLHKWDPSVFYLDFGQSLHIWFLDNPEVLAPWLTFHPRLIMENCKLDEFYEGLGIHLAAPFGLSMSDEREL
ncbi:hypothetical protein [Rhizobium oryziradicis]|nr:hypothetical protein [Rhizobium oryziradicis]